MHRIVKLLVLCCVLLAPAAPALAAPKPKNGMVQNGPTGGMSAAKRRAYQYYLYRNRGRRGVATGAGYGSGPIWDGRAFGYPTGGF